MHWDPRHIHFEDFVGVTGGRRGDAEFTVIWHPTAAEVRVASNQTIVQALREHGIAAESSCDAGACGTCTLRFLSGEVEHRDVVLSETDRLTMVSACVSRAATPALVLTPIDQQPSKD
jgi:phthalate 4,5-dioxygenase reductase subunit